MYRYLILLLALLSGFGCSSAPVTVTLRDQTFRVEIADNDAFENWEEAGSVDAATRANRRWKKALADYEAPALDEGIDEALKDFIARKKGSMEDMWY